MQAVEKACDAARTVQGALRHGRFGADATASSLQVKLHHRSSQLNPELWETYIIAALTKSKEVCCFFAVMYFLTFPHINLHS